MIKEKLRHCKFMIFQRKRKQHKTLHSMKKRLESWRLSICLKRKKRKSPREKRKLQKPAQPKTSKSLKTDYQLHQVTDKNPWIPKIKKPTNNQSKKKSNLKRSQKKSKR